MGVNAAAMSWDVPEGSDDGTFDTYILVANPNDFPVNVQVQFFLEGGGRITVPSVTVAADQAPHDRHELAQDDRPADDVRG